MIGFGGLAAGLAQGIQSGMQLANQKEMMELRKQEMGRLAKSDERDAEIHEMNKDRHASEKEIRDRRNNALRKIALYTQNITGEGAAAAPQQAPGAVPMQTPAPQAGLATAAPMPQATAAPGTLAAATQQPQQEEMPPAKVLEKGMVTGMYTPKMLTDIANIFASEGLHEEGIKYMNTAYEAKKRGAVDAGMAFMQNNPGAASDALRQGGIELEGLPVKAKPDDPNDMNWKLNIKGQGEKTINVRDWMASTMNYEDFLKAEDRRKKDERDAAMDERKQDYVERKGNAELGLDAQKTRAQIDLLKERGALARATASKAGMVKPTKSSDRSIEQAISRRDKRFDLKATVSDIDGVERVDPELRGAYDDAAAQLQSIIEDETGEELDHRQHHKLTDEMLRFPINGTPQEKAKATAALLKRFKLDMDQPAEAAPKEEPKALSGKAPERGKAPPAAALKAKKEPTREEQELKAIESNRNYPMLRAELKKLQKERYASNLNAKEKAEVEAKIKAILDSDRPKGSLK